MWLLLNNYNQILHFSVRQLISFAGKPYFRTRLKSGSDWNSYFFLCRYLSLGARVEQLTLHFQSFCCAFIEIFERDRISDNRLLDFWLRKGRLLTKIAESTATRSC